MTCHVNTVPAHMRPWDSYEIVCKVHSPDRFSVILVLKLRVLRDYSITSQCNKTWPKMFLSEQYKYMWHSKGEIIYYFNNSAVRWGIFEILMKQYIISTNTHTTQSYRLPRSLFHHHFCSKKYSAVCDFDFAAYSTWKNNSSNEKQCISLCHGLFF